MNIIRCWSRSLGFFFNPRLLFKELSDYFATAYRSVFLYIVVVSILSFKYMNPATIMQQGSLTCILLVAIGILIPTLKIFIRYFFVQFGRNIQSLADVFTCARKNRATILYLLLVIYLARLAFYFGCPVAKEWFVSRGGDYVENIADFATTVGYLTFIMYPLFSFYVLFVFDGIGYSKSVARALGFFFCNLPFIIIWMALEGLSAVFFGRYFRGFLLLWRGSTYAVSYFLFVVVYLYYERMKKSVR